ncbi:hypothetical protein HYU13_02850 [Candidatus Woesearchaeota archaeon]|nr:hypothetical protein [Candidatus Woesearchaeota archaeon]
MAEDLENRVEDKESKGWIRKAFDIGVDVTLAAATTALSVATVGSSGFIVGGAFALGSLIGNLSTGKKFYDSFRESMHSYTAVNAVIAPIIWLGQATFPLFPASDTLIGYLSRSLYSLTAYNAAFVGSFGGARHLASNYLNPVGMVDAVTKDFWKKCAIVGTIFSPGYILDANGVSSIMGIPTFAYNALPAGFLAASGLADEAYDFMFGKKEDAHGNKEEKKEKNANHSAGHTGYYDPRWLPSMRQAYQ